MGRSAERFAFVALSLSSAVSLVGTSSVAFADGTSEDKATAQALFDEGKRLMDKEQYAQACLKLGDSQRLDPGIGTMLNLAVCFERNGQTASAWATFRDAAGVAKGVGQTEREKFAREHAAALEPQLARMAIVVPAGNLLDGLLVRRDGQPVPTSSLGLAVPIDPGEHTVEASAPRHHTWATKTTATASSSTEVSIPMLEPEAVTIVPPAAAPAPLPSPAPAIVLPVEQPSPGEAQRTWGIVGGVAGLAAMGVSVGLGVAARSMFDASKQPSGQDPQCSVGGVCTPQGEQQQKNAQGLAGIGTGIFVGGAVLVTAGAVLYLTAPSKSTAPRGAALRIEPALGGAMLRGTW